MFPTLSTTPLNPLKHFINCLVKTPLKAWTSTKKIIIKSKASIYILEKNGSHQKKSFLIEPYTMFTLENIKDPKENQCSKNLRQSNKNNCSYFINLRYQGHLTSLSIINSITWCLDIFVDVEFFINIKNAKNQEMQIHLFLRHAPIKVPPCHM
jgi:hypothetical protein